MKILLKRRQHRIFIRKKSALYNSCCCKNKQELQCNGLTSNVNIRIRFFFLSNFLLTSIFFVLFFCETIFHVFITFFELASFIKNVFFVETYIPMENSNLSLTKYTFILWKRKRKRWSFDGYKGSFFQNFPLV